MESFFFTPQGIKQVFSNEGAIYVRRIIIVEVPASQKAIGFGSL